MVHKKARMTELQKSFLEKLAMIEKKRTEREQIQVNIKSALGQYNSSKKEINQIKKQD